MRVFHLIKSLGLGGAESLLLSGFRESQGGRCTYAYGYFLPWKDALVAPLRKEGAEVSCFDAASAAGMMRRTGEVARFIKRWRADVIHCHLPMAGVVGRMAGRLAGVPVVYTEHNLLERYHRLTRAANVATWRLQSAAIAVSHEVAASIKRQTGERVPLKVVQNGIPLERFGVDAEAAARIRETWRIPQGAPVLGTVAVFRTQKQLDDWLRAAQRIRRSIPDAHFLLVGDGPMRAQLEALAGELGLADRVRFTGLQEEARSFMAAMDVYLMSSVFEGLPLALLEAMATERAVVATRVGGIPEVIEDGSTGVLVEPRRHEQLAAEVCALLSDGARRQRMGAAARRRVEERFSMRRMLGELEGVYADVLGGRARA